MGTSERQLLRACLRSACWAAHVDTVVGGGSVVLFDCLSVFFVALFFVGAQTQTSEKYTFVQACDQIFDTSNQSLVSSHLLPARSCDYKMQYQCAHRCKIFCVKVTKAGSNPVSVCVRSVRVALSEIRYMGVERNLSVRLGICKGNTSNDPFSRCKSVQQFGYR